MVTIGQKLNDFANELYHTYGRNVTAEQMKEITAKVEGFQKKRNGNAYVWVHDLMNGEVWVCFDSYTGGFHGARMLDFHITA